MYNIETQYCDLLRKVIASGAKKADRTKVGTKSIFGAQLRHDLNDGFPLFTKKSVHFKSVAEELFWFLRVETNIGTLQSTIWNEWAKENGDLGRIYGAQWRTWQSANGEVIDQIANVIQSIKTDPDSRRHLISAWNVGELSQMALPPCHYAFQFYVENGKLSCMFNMRSCDLFLGFCFNIASYALLTHIVANICGLGVGEIIATLGDAHVYLNHLEAIEKYLSNEQHALPTLKIVNPIDSDLKGLKFNDFQLIGYKHSGKVNAPVAV
jgi:thymidylate synthase